MNLLMTVRFGVLRCASNRVANIASGYLIGTRCSLASSSHSGIRAEYDGLVEGGKLQFNPCQSNAVDRLQKLQDTLAGYEPPIKHRTSWTWASLFT